jgi:hypothetical protein
VGDRLAQWELGSAFAGDIGNSLGLEGFVEFWYRIDADVLLPAAEVDNWPAADAEGWDSVADRLLQARSSRIFRAAWRMVCTSGENVAM